MRFIILLGLICLLKNRLTDAANIECSYSGSSPSYSCSPISVDAISSQSETITVSGTHSAGYGNNDVSYIYFNSPIVLSFVPSKLFNIFPNIIQTGFSQVQLSSMSSNAIQSCLNLEYMQFTQNSFSELPASFAESCSKLRYVTFYMNHIKKIHKDAFKGLTSLENVMFYYENVTYIEPETFSYTPNMTFISFYNTEISSLHPDTFKGLSKLGYLDLSGNFIKVLPAMNLEGTNTLQYFSLYHNLVEAINPDFYNTFPGFSFLSPNWMIQLQENVCINDYFSQDKPYEWTQLSNCTDAWNLISTTTTSTTPRVDSGSCSSQKACRYFLDEKKKYTCVLEGVDLLLTSITGEHDPGFVDSDVENLYFVDSILSEVPRAIFDKFVSLKFLSVRASQMTIINDNTFEVCGGLKKLDASYNEIDRVTKTSLQVCSQLEWLDLTGNPVDQLESELYQFDPSLKHIILNRKIPVLP